MKKTILITWMSLLIVASGVMAADTLYEYYHERGQPLPSISERAEIAIEAGIVGEADSYVGNYAQNTALLEYLQGQDSEFGSSAPVTATNWRLSSPITSSATTIPLTNVNDIRGNAVATSSLPYKIYLMVEAESSSNAEIAVCPRSGFDQTNKQFSNCTRGLAFYGGGESSVTANKKAHPAGVTANMTNVGQFFNLFGGIYDNNTWEALNVFATSTDSDSYIQLSTSTPSYIKEVNGVLYYCNNGLSCATIGGGANTYSFISPLGTSGNEVSIATSTAWFTLTNSELAIATSTGSNFDLAWKDAWNATTTKNLAFTFSDGLTVTGNASSTSLVVGTTNPTVNLGDGDALISGNATTTGSFDAAQLLENNTPISMLYDNVTATTTDLNYSYSEASTVTAYTYSIPGNTIGTSGSVKVSFGGTYTHVSVTGSWAVKYGGTTICSYGDFSATKSYFFECNFSNKGSASRQLGGIESAMDDAANTYTEYNLAGSGTVDSSSAQDLTITVTLGHADNTITVDNVRVEILTDNN